MIKFSGLLDYLISNSLFDNSWLELCLVDNIENLNTLNSNSNEKYL